MTGGVCEGFLCEIEVMLFCLQFRKRPTVKIVELEIVLLFIYFIFFSE